MTIDLLFNLLTLLTLTLINSAVIWGLHGGAETIGFNDDFKDRLPEWIYKPLTGCPICQPTLWTIPIMIACGFMSSGLPMYYLVLVWLGTAGINYVIIQFQKKDDK